MEKAPDLTVLILLIAALIVCLCLLRYHVLKKEKYDNHLNNTIANEFAKKMAFRQSCSPKDFKQKIVNFFREVKTYREQEESLRKMQEDVQKKYQEYDKTGKRMEESQKDLDFCIKTVST
jgi:hypothetical protein